MNIYIGLFEVPRCLEDIAKKQGHKIQKQVDKTTDGVILSEDNVTAKILAQHLQIKQYTVDDLLSGRIDNVSGR